MEEQETVLRDRVRFSFWRIDGAAGVAKYEWGVGFSMMLYGLDSGIHHHPMFGIRFQLGPLWMDLEI